MSEIPKSTSVSESSRIESGTPKKKRLQFDASPELVAQIEELGAQIDSVSMTETLRRAVQLTLQLVREQDAGSKLATIDKDGKPTLLTLVY